MFPPLELPHLRDLSVHICPIGRESKSVRWFPDFLSSIHPGLPYRLTIGIHARDLSELELIRFSRFDAILSAKAYAGMQQLVLAVSVGHRRLITWGEVHRYITGELPETMGTGVVEFVYT